MRDGWMKIGIAVLLISALWFGSSVGHAALPVDQSFDAVVAQSYGSSMTEGNVTYAVTGTNADMVVDSGSNNGITDTTGVLSGNVLTEVNMVATGVLIQAMESVKISSFSFYADQVFAVRGLLAGGVVAEVTGVSVTTAGSVGTTDSAITIGTPYVDTYGSGATLTFDGALWGEVDRVEVVFAAGTMWFMDNVRFGAAVPVVSATPTPSVTPSPTPSPSATPSPIPVPSVTPTLTPVSTPTPTVAPAVYVAPASTPEPVVIQVVATPEPVVVPEKVVLPEVHYSDIPVGHWARVAIEELGARRIVLGTGNGKFTPDRLMTHGEFERVLARVLGKDLAAGTGVSRKEITREEAFVLVGRRFGELGLVPAGDYENPYVYLYRFGDYWKVSAWAKPSVGMGVKLGLVTGDARGMLVPQGRMTRAEVAVLVWRLVGKVEG